MPANGPEWRKVDTRALADGAVMANVGPGEAKYVRLTFDVTGPGRITAFGVDAVTVAGAEVIIDANDAIAELSGKDQRLVGKRVLNTAGEDLGPVTDVDFDPDTGRLVALALAAGSIAGARLLRIGSYAAVVHPDS